MLLFGASDILSKSYLCLSPRPGIVYAVLSYLTSDDPDS